jgi:MFS family permease
MLSTNLMTQLTGSSADIRLLTTFGLFGMGMGMVNSQISVAAVAGMPAYQAGLASGIASASRQVGQALGVAVSGSLLTAKAHGRIHAAFTLASNPAWHLLFWCAFVVVISGLATTRARARHAMAGNASRPGRQLPGEQVPYSPPPPLPQRLPRRSLPSAQPEPEPAWLPRFLMDADFDEEPPAGSGFLAAPPGDPAGE